MSGKRQEEREKRGRRPIPDSSPASRAPPRSAEAGCTLRRGRSARGAALICNPGRNGQVGNRRVLGLAGPVRHYCGVAVRPRKLDGLERLGEGSDLVDLDEDRVRHALIDSAAKSLYVRHEEVVADKLNPVAEPLGRLRHDPHSSSASASSIDTTGNRSATSTQKSIIPSRSNARPSKRYSPSFQSSVVAGSSAIATRSRCPARSALEDDLDRLATRAQVRAKPLRHRRRSPGRARGTAPSARGRRQHRSAAPRRSSRRPRAQP